MSRQYDAVIIGAGHNGLVAAALLAKAGQKVLVLEQRAVLGGAAATEESFSGFKYNTGAADAGMFRPEIVSALELEKHGLEFIEGEAAVFAPQLDGKSFTIWRDTEKSVQEIAQFSQRDAAKFPQYVKFTRKLADVLAAMALRTPPALPHTRAGELLPWASVALQVRRLGGRDMMALLRTLPMTATEFLNEWFEHKTLKAALGAPAVAGSMQGPQSAGTAFTLLYQHMGGENGGFVSSRFVRGGMGTLSEALANAARAHGAETRLGAGVERIVLKNDKAVGVIAGGEEISASVVASSADPRRTLFGLVGAPELEPRVMQRVRNIKFRGTTAKVNLAVSELPNFTGSMDGAAHLSGHIVICPDLDYLERAFDNAKYGEISANPYLDITIPSILDNSLAPAGKHVISITAHYAPYNLKNGDWDSQRQAFADRVIDTLNEYAPNVRKSILHCQAITPLDYEREYGLTGGDIHHGQMGLDQILFMRPIPGYGQYRMPIENLYLCSAGAHPGGGVTGAPGYNAARAILKDLKRG